MIKNNQVMYFSGFAEFENLMTAKIKPVQLIVDCL